MQFISSNIRYSNTTLVKVKSGQIVIHKLAFYSNTTLVKVKFYYIPRLTKWATYSNTTLVKVKSTEYTASITTVIFKYNSC